MNGYQVIGIVHSTGVFEGQSYDNYVFHCVHDAIHQNQSGQLCEVIKVKSAILSQMPKIGDSIIPFYDQYKRVIQVQIL